MSVVSDTSPILNLAIIGQLDLLHRQFVEVVIPAAVLDELKIETDLPGSNLVRGALSANWLRALELRDSAASRALMLDLDSGEAEAIALALQEGIGRVLIDEHDARTVARRLGLTPVGLLGVLLAAKRIGDLDSVEKTMRKLQDEAGFHIAKDLFESLLREAGER
jgi:uncharacterized protein